MKTFIHLETIRSLITGAEHETTTPKSLSLSISGPVQYEDLSQTLLPQPQVRVFTCPDHWTGFHYQNIAAPDCLFVRFFT